MKQQAVAFGADLREIASVEAIEPRPGGGWLLVTDDETVAARAVVLSPGVEARKLGVPGEADFMGRGVWYCATCDGPLYRDKEVVVIGGGDAAVEEGMFLARFASTVHVIHRRAELRAAKIGQERAFAQPDMDFHWNVQVRRIVGETEVEAVVYEDLLDHTQHTLPVAGVFFYVGQLPDTAFLQDVVEFDENGYIVTDQHLRTGRPGLFACGDARAGLIKQIANAVARARWRPSRPENALKRSTSRPSRPASPPPARPSPPPADERHRTSLRRT